MKIVCDACQAKYSISDDKVQGKVFKIRCKKCSNIIVVRGGAGAAEAAPAAQEKDTRVYDYGADAGGGGGDESVWHVVINQDQVGPMTAAEVQQRFSSGEIDGETYAWREGFADWMPLSQVDAFASMVSAGTTRSAGANGGGGAAAVSAMFGGGGGDDAGTVRSDPGDLFSAASASAAARGGAGDDDGGDLFGGSSRGGAAAPAASGGSAGSKLRGERNENSVLFSLNNLAQLASDKPAPSASVVSTPSGHATGAAGGEGSGLIDIRSMANAYLGGSAGAAKPAASVGSIDDLPVFGGGGFSEPAVLVPTAQRASNNKMLYMLIGSVGLLAVAAVVMVVVLLKGGDKDSKDDKTDDKVAMAGSDDKGTTENKTPETKEPGAGGTDTAAKTPETKEPGAGSADVAAKTPETKEPETKEPETKEPETKKPDTTAKKPETKRPETKKPGGTTTVAAKTPEKKPDPPPAKEPAGGGGCDEVSCVLNNYDGACCQKFKKGGSKPTGNTTTAKPASGGGGDLPDGLDRTMIQDGVNKVKARVMGCGDKSSAKGQVKVSVKVAPSGAVTGVTVKSSPDAALGSCVASAMQKASFAKTQNGGSFAYPWNF